MFQFFDNSKSPRASKSYYWFNSYDDFAEWVDFAYWLSCIGKGLRLQPAQQACLLYIHFCCITYELNSPMFVHLKLGCS